MSVAIDSECKMATTFTEETGALDPLDDLYRMSVEEYEQLAATDILRDDRVELINGMLVRKMTKKPRHVIVTEALRRAIEEALPSGWHIRQEQPIRLSAFDEPEPDLGVIRGLLFDRSDRHPGPADIGLVIEVSESSIHRDKGEKLAAYSRAGVGIYWIVNLVDDMVEVHTNPDSTGGRYETRQSYEIGEPIPLVLDGIEHVRIVVLDPS